MKKTLLLTTLIFLSNLNAVDNYIYYEFNENWKKNIVTPKIKETTVKFHYITMEEILKQQKEEEERFKTYSSKLKLSLDELNYHSDEWHIAADEYIDLLEKRVRDQDIFKIVIKSY